MATDADASFSRPVGRGNNIERVPLPKFGGQPELRLDFHSGFNAILGKCEQAIEMVCTRNALPEAENKIILGVTKPALSILDRQYCNSDMIIA